jgi:type II secretory ATPase GspE/PulE/Tfp pilus assembly ATPase PilB-like protein
MSEEGSAIETLERLVQQAEAARASDIHVQMNNGSAEVHFRLDGILVPVMTVPEGMADRLLGRIKYLGRLKTYQESLPQDGRIDKSDLGTRCDLRVATYPTVTGEKVVLRLFQAATVRSLSELGFPGDACARLVRFLGQSAGLLLLTGPAGSGKTTTIYACLRHLVDLGGRHVITVEDPVEQVVPGIMQTEVNEAMGLTFAKAAKHLLRQDPQVLVIGEIRDDETATLAVRAALTGHLVISTLHAGSCQGVFERLLAMCPDRYAVAAGVGLVVNQRLMRRLCAGCHGARCDACVQTGYQGRMPVVEWGDVSDDLRDRIGRGEGFRVIPQRTLEQSAREICQRGDSDEAEFRRVIGHLTG